MTDPLLSVSAKVAAAYRRIDEVDRPEIWITLRSEIDVLADADRLAERVSAGETLPLAGLLLAVKDNMDVAGLPTTAGCPAYSYQPAETAPAVLRLLDAGALLVGKTNMDQFATGLIGTRSPYGAVRDARRPERVSGGSSSGSGVAVALGLVDIALGTDTAGSGRVPAAFGGIVGLKPTYGLVPTRGVVPACREVDCVSVFAASVGLAERAVAAMTGPDPSDPTSRIWPADRPLAAPPNPRLAVPRADQLGSLSPTWRAAYDKAIATFETFAVEVVEIDISPFLSAGALLYGGAFVASRYAAVGAFLRDNPGEVDPTVAAIVAAAAQVSAADWVADTERLETLGLHARAALAGFDALVLPTVSQQPTIAEVAADPIGVNARLGQFTTFVNPLGMAAVAVPAGDVDGGCFGISVIVPGFADRVAADLAARFAGESPVESELAGIGLVVVGAHLSGLPLNHQLTSRGCRLVREVKTAPCYRMYALDSTPAKPGLQRVAEGGAAVIGELWDVPPAALAELLASLPSPMSFGPVLLDDGTRPVGFQCEAIAVAGAEDITDFGGWRAYLAQRA